jgi:hypothetical protein
MGRFGWMKKDSVAVLRDWLQILALGSRQSGRSSCWWRSTAARTCTVGKAVVLTSACKIEVTGESEKYNLVSVSFTLSSASKIRYFIVDSPFQMKVIKYRSVDGGTPLADLFKDANASFAALPVFSRNPRFAQPDSIPLEYGRLLQTYTYLEPNSRYEFTFLTMVSKKTLENFEALAFKADFILAAEPAKLGTRVVIDDSGEPKVTLIAYRKPRRTCSRSWTRSRTR